MGSDEQSVNHLGKSDRHVYVHTKATPCVQAWLRWLRLGDEKKKKEE